MLRKNYGQLSDSLPAGPYPSVMKKTESKKPLPKLEIKTLDHRELSKVTGGLPPRDCGTADTCNICHIDGTID